MNSFWSFPLLNNTIRDWAITVGIIFLVILTARICQRYLLKKLHRLANKTSSTFDDFLVAAFNRSVMPFLYIVAFYFGLQYLQLPAWLQKVLHASIIAVTVFFIIRMIVASISYAFDRFTGSTDKNQSQVKQAKGILLIINIILWGIGIIFMIDNLGYNITTIIAGLGVGGIAIALAAQAVLADLFSYLVIFFDKPFEIGDFIMIGDKAGVVEYIGIKTTRLRTLSGEQLIASNTDLTNSRVQNFKRMEKRRALFSIGVTYETSAEKLKRVPIMIKEIIEKVEGVQFDRAHFSGFGDFSLNFEVVYYILTSDYNQYMDRQQDIYMNLFQRFEKEQIDFAYPTQKVLVSGKPVMESAGSRN